MMQVPNIPPLEEVAYEYKNGKEDCVNLHVKAIPLSLVLSKNR